MNLNYLDYLVVALYFVIVIAAGFIPVFRKNGEKETVEDYILAGRRISLPFFVASLVATWYGNILGMGEFVYSSGIVAWVTMGLPYYFAAFFFAMFIAKKIRKSQAQSIPDQISANYGTKAGKVAAIIVLLLTIPAAYTLMLGALIQLPTGWPLNASIIIGTIVTLLYLYKGGLKADLFANSAQFIFMYLGFGALVVFSVLKLGSPSEMLAKLPEGHLSFLGGRDIQYVVAWFVIAFQTFVDPSFHQRCAGADDSDIPRKGVLISILFWILFDFLTLTSGLYAKAYFTIGVPLEAYPTIANAVLPSIWKGLFFTSMLATVMSTLDSYAFISASTIGRDLLFPLFKEKYDAKKLTKIGLIITGLVSTIMAIALPSAIDLIYKTSSIAVPALLIPLTVSYSSKYYLSKSGAIRIMFLSAGVSFIWTLGVIGFQKFNLNSLSFFTIFEPMVPGVIVAVLLGLLFIKKVK